VLVEGRVRAEGEIPPSVSRQRIADDYFETMGMPPLAGRVFEPSDHARPTRVVVVDERFAALYFPGEDPIGQRVWPGFLESTAEWYEVVGVVPHVVTTSLASPERRPQLYLPLTSHSTEGMPSPHGVHLLARTSTPPLDLVGAVRAAVAELDPGIPLGRITTLEEILERDRGPMAFTMVLILIAGLSALTLGLVGAYGVIAFGVSQRTGEIGIRLAMGARPADVARLVLRQGGVVAALGVVVGLGVALAASGLLESMLFDVSPTDPATYAAVALGLFLVSLAACWVPARRASRLDPVEALRNE
jgi:predicted permease